jgi:hypothetical protein
MVRARAKANKKANPLFGRGSYEIMGFKKGKSGLATGRRKKVGTVRAFTRWGAERSAKRYGKKSGMFLGATKRVRKTRRGKKKYGFSLFNPAQRIMARQLAMRDNPGKIRFSDEDLAKYAGKIKGLGAFTLAPKPKRLSSQRSVFAAPKKRKASRRFKKAGIFGGSGLLGLGRSSKQIKANSSRGQRRLGRVLTGQQKKAARSGYGGSVAGLLKAHSKFTRKVAEGTKRRRARAKKFGLFNPKGSKAKRRNPSGGIKRLGRVLKSLQKKDRRWQSGADRFRQKQRIKYKLSESRRREWPGRLPNSSPSNVFSEFRGKQVASRSKGFAAKGTPAQLATLGKLKELRLRGKRLQFGGRATLAASGRKRLYVANVRMKRPNPPGEIDYGELVGVVYYSDKPHIETGSYNYEHKFERPLPHLIVDEEGLPKIEGGGYSITEDGIEG